MSAPATFTPGSDLPGWMTDQELWWLYHTAARMQSVCEVGCWKGRSTVALCSSACPKVYAVDHWRGDERTGPAGDAVFAEFLRNVCRFTDKLHIVMAASVAGAEMVPDVDMVFIDANHDYEAIAEDLRVWTPKARVMVCGHDFTSMPGVNKAVREMFTDSEIQVCGDIWYVEKTN